jgi:hypothetical protein
MKINFSFKKKNYIKINSRILFGPVNSNFYLQDYLKGLLIRKRPVASVKIAV